MEAVAEDTKEKMQGIFPFFPRAIYDTRRKTKYSGNSGSSSKGEGYESRSLKLYIQLQWVKSLHSHHHQHHHHVFLSLGSWKSELWCEINKKKKEHEEKERSCNLVKVSCLPLLSSISSFKSPQDSNCNSHELRKLLSPSVS